jgi:DedD protein
MAQDNLQSQGEQEIQFKKRARRRLVGAVALVLLMILLLPILLEDRVGQAPKEDVVISIPSQDNQFQPNSDAGSVHQDQPSKVSPAPSALNAPAVESSPTDNQAPVSNAPINSVQVNQSKPVEPTAPVIESKSEVGSSESKITTKEEAKLKPVEPNLKSEDMPVAAGIYLQIGVFSDPENVKRMQIQLSDKGLKYKSELIDTSKGKKTRLRVGPFNTKKDADLALVNLKSIKLTGTVVNN